MSFWIDVCIFVNGRSYIGAFGRGFEREWKHSIPELFAFHAFGTRSSTVPTLENGIPASIFFLPNFPAATRWKLAQEEEICTGKAKMKLSMSEMPSLCIGKFHRLPSEALHRSIWPTHAACRACGAAGWTLRSFATAALLHRLVIISSLVVAPFLGWMVTIILI